MGQQRPTFYVEGRRLKCLRTAMGMSQTALADALGISNKRLNNWEMGLNAVPTSVHQSLYRDWGVSADYIINGRIEALPFNLIGKVRKAEETMPWS